MRAIPSRVKAIILCNPHNPIGRLWSKEELTQTGEIVMGHGAIVISDEIHCEILFIFFDIPVLSQRFFYDGDAIRFAAREYEVAGHVDFRFLYVFLGNQQECFRCPFREPQFAKNRLSSNDKIFIYPSIWPPEPRDRWVTANALDTIVPRENFSLQDMWCAYSDVLPENHISPGKPQNIDVYQTVYAWNYPSNQDIFFINIYIFPIIYLFQFLFFFFLGSRLHNPHGIMVPYPQILLKMEKRSLMD
jgi:hypothetical protein